MNIYDVLCPPSSVFMSRRSPPRHVQPCLHCGACQRWHGELRESGAGRHIPFLQVQPHVLWADHNHWDDWLVFLFSMNWRILGLVLLPSIKYLSVFALKRWLAPACTVAPHFKQLLRSLLKGRRVVLVTRKDWVTRKGRVRRGKGGGDSLQELIRCMGGSKSQVTMWRNWKPYLSREKKKKTNKKNFMWFWRYLKHRRLV